MAFLPRHGKSHSIAPHRINYRANIAALKEMGVEYILATASTGTCTYEYRPRELVVVDDCIDFTYRRINTFFDEEGVRHLNMEKPYCSSLRQRLIQLMKERGKPFKESGVYVCTEGPRFESPAEVRMFRQMGGHVVGMTGLPEAVLARELGMCYAAVAIPVNWCTGMGDEELDIDVMHEALAEGRRETIDIFLSVFQEKALNRGQCNCMDSFIM